VGYRGRAGSRRLVHVEVLVGEGGGDAAGLRMANEKRECPVRLRRTGHYKGHGGFPVRGETRNARLKAAATKANSTEAAVDCQLTTAGAASSAPTRAPGMPAFPIRRRPGRANRGRRPLQLPSCHPERSEGSLFGLAASDGPHASGAGAGREIPRRFAPRNDRRIEAGRDGGS
jgi:hypothetical protein